MPIAIVEDDSPLTVRIKGDAAGTLAQLKSSTLAALAVNDLVWAEVDPSDRKLVVICKLVGA